MGIIVETCYDALLIQLILEKIKAFFLYSISSNEYFKEVPQNSDSSYF